MLVRYASFLTIALALLLPTESRSQHALNLPTLVNPTFLCDFQIEETFLFEYINSLEKNNRLEQERIPLFYIKEILEKMKIELSSKIQNQTSTVC